jgi:hypothetical protein
VLLSIQNPKAQWPCSILQGSNGMHMCSTACVAHKNSIHRLHVQHSSGQQQAGVCILGCVDIQLNRYIEASLC